MKISCSTESVPWESKGREISVLSEDSVEIV